MPAAQTLDGVPEGALILCRRAFDGGFSKISACHVWLRKQGWTVDERILAAYLIGKHFPGATVEDVPDLLSRG